MVVGDRLVPGGQRAVAPLGSSRGREPVVRFGDQAGLLRREYWGQRDARQPADLLRPRNGDLASATGTVPQSPAQRVQRGGQGTACDTAVHEIVSDVSEIISGTRSMLPHADDAAATDLSHPRAMHAMRDQITDSTRSQWIALPMLHISFAADCTDDSIPQER